MANGFKIFALKLSSHSSIFYFLLLLIISAAPCAAQVIVAPPAASADTLRIIQIIQGNSLREKRLDSSTRLQTIAGSVILSEGKTLFYCDSATINSFTHIVEAFGHVHINQNDSIHTYSQYLKYVGLERMAYLKKDVKLTDKKGSLYTQELDYNLQSNVGNYINGGKVINGNSILTSLEGTYYANTRDVYFKKNVHLVDPKYDIVSDSLLYNTQSQLVTFITATAIKSKNGGDIYTTNGSYDLKDGKAFFGNRTIIKDSTRTYVANESAYDEKSGIAQLEGNAIIKDSVNGYTILGNQIFLDKNNNSFLATRKPVLIFKGEGNDSTIISADTLFSGVEVKTIKGKSIIKTDTLKSTKIVKLKAVDASKNQLAIVPISPASGTDSLLKATNKPSVSDSVKEANTTLKADATIAQIRKTETGQNKMTIEAALLQKANGDTLSESLVPKKAIPLKQAKQANAPKDSTIRFFEAFHHVRIYNDSMQAVCDSLFFSSEDSTFRLYKSPVLFAQQSQVAGDTIYLFTENKKAKRLYVFENGIIINETGKGKLYNQIGGRTINGYLIEGALDVVRVKGSPAESIYYPQDQDSAYVGMNRSKGDVIDAYFINKAITKIKFTNDVDGTLFPFRQIPEDKRYLKNFKWWQSRRPKNKYVLFE